MNYIKKFCQPYTSDHFIDVVDVEGTIPIKPKCSYLITSIGIDIMEIKIRWE